MLAVAIYIQDIYTLEYNRLDLFDDEKISITSSIQNINDISITFTDFSQTFTVPASKQNNKIFRHWYDNSNDIPFSTFVKSNAYIEIDTIPFRSGKIQLESANLIDGQAQDYSITFIGTLGSLKDKFNGLYLKDLTSTAYDFAYSPTVVRDKIVGSATSSDIMFPLISSSRYWNYGSTTDPTNNINNINNPIRYNELFPAIRLNPILNMISTQFGINFNGSFLSDSKFTNAYLWLKNADEFEFQTISKINFSSSTVNTATSVSMNYTTDVLTLNNPTTTNPYFKTIFNLKIQFSAASKPYSILVYKNNLLYKTINKTSTGSLESYLLGLELGASANGDYTFFVQATDVLTFNNVELSASLYGYYPGTVFIGQTIFIQSVTQTTSSSLPIKNYFPDIKIEDFFSGILKMFNLTCFSTDGINYTIEQLDNYYNAGNDIDLTKYIFQDKKALNRVKTYKKINFDYESSESLINVAFKSNAGLEYGSLYYSTTPQADGEEYSIKLPFEDLNFQNLKDKLQVGYALKTDFQKYIPKPVILYDYNPSALTTLTGTTYYFSTALTGSGTGYTSYKAFGQEYYDGTDTYSLNFPPQQSTLTNEVISNGLYQMYYSNYFNNIFNYKARLIKVSAILPTSLLTSIKLNDSVIIRDAKYIINTMNIDLTTGELQFELLTDQRL